MSLRCSMASVLLVSASLAPQLDGQTVPPLVAIAGHGSWRFTIARMTRLYLTFTSGEGFCQVWHFNQDAQFVYVVDNEVDRN